MSKEFPDRHPKLKGRHALLHQFRTWFQGLQENDGIICIIPYGVKRDIYNRTPEEKWRRKFEVVKPIANPNEPVITVKLIHGPLSQRVDLSARDIETLQRVGLIKAD